MNHYYLINCGNKDLEEITYEEWLTIVGEQPHRSYANRVYVGKITIDEVPEEYRSTVESIVANKLARWGEYENTDIPSEELETMVEEVL